jgi:hypothetical protein
VVSFVAIKGSTLGTPSETDGRRAPSQKLRVLLAPFATTDEKFNEYCSPVPVIRHNERHGRVDVSLSSLSISCGLPENPTLPDLATLAVDGIFHSTPVYHFNHAERTDEGIERILTVAARTEAVLNLCDKFR